MKSLSPNGLAFIKRWEDVKLTAYQDIAGIWTIAYGATKLHGRPVVEGDEIDLEEASFLLMQEVRDIPRKVDDLVIPELNQNQTDALVSFCYNLGLAAFKNSTLRRVINIDIGNTYLIRTEWKRWNKYHTPDGKLKVSKGLTNRRLAEYQLFIS